MRFFVLTQSYLGGCKVHIFLWHYWIHTHSDLFPSVIKKVKSTNFKWCKCHKYQQVHCEGTALDGFYDTVHTQPWSLHISSMSLVVFDVWFYITIERIIVTEKTEESCPKLLVFILKSKLLVLPHKSTRVCIRTNICCYKCASKTWRYLKFVKLLSFSQLCHSDGETMADICLYPALNVCVYRCQFLSWTLSIVRILWQIIYFGRITVLSNIASGKENQTTANIQGPDKECALDISL